MKEKIVLLIISNIPIVFFIVKYSLNKDNLIYLYFSIILFTLNLVLIIGLKKKY
jgi:hypothetical protein